jgi:CHAT domain-containing protein/tetratricopeptide (TPR) repeat protein
VWIEVAANGVQAGDPEGYLIHAGECDHCGPLLKNALADLTTDLLPEEEGRIAALRSSVPVWQHELAATLQRSSARHPVKPAIKRRRIWVTFAVGASVALAIAVWVGIRLTRTAEPDQLLAEAYTQHRTLEVRIPGAQYAPLQVRRGSSTSQMDKPTTLLKAEALISENLRKSPNDPIWLDARSRADLLDGNYDSAVATLRNALLTHPDSAQLLADLGSAYYMRAESTDHSVDYGNAIEVWGKALAARPNDSITLFNRALGCEKLFLYNQAIDDWNRYLRLDPLSEWTREAHEHLAAIQQILNKRQKSNAKPLLRPRDFEALSPAQGHEVTSQIEERIEVYQEQALASWIPEAFATNKFVILPPAASRRALQLLAGIIERNNGDPWLADLLHTISSEDRGIRTLLAGDSAMHNGRYGLAIKAGRQSESDFAHSHNVPGALLATLEVMRAEDASLQYLACVLASAQTIPILEHTSYHWLQASISIELGQCLAGAAHMSAAIASNRKGWELAQRYRYPELQLRATAFGANYLLTTGHAEEGLQELRGGLSLFWKSSASDRRGENLYSSLFNTADGVNWAFVDVSTLNEIAIRFPSADPVSRVVEKELLAGAEERTGDYPAARETLRVASLELGALPDDPGVQIRKAEIAEEAAEIQLHHGDPASALDSLLSFRKELDIAGPGRFQAEYFKTLGEAYLLTHDDGQAQSALAQSLALRETGLLSLHDEREKLVWARARGELYRDLLEVRIRLGTPESALAFWERYKGSSLRPSRQARGHVGSNSLPTLPPSYLPHQSALISYAILRDSIAVFVVRDNTVHLHILPRPSNLEQLISRILQFSSDPASDVDLLETAGADLYGVLFKPIESEISDAKSLQIEPDGIIESIPFSVLRGDDRAYLADKFEITISPGSAYGKQTSQSTSLDRLTRALIVVSSGSNDRSSPPLPGANEEGSDVASYFVDPTIISGSSLAREVVFKRLRTAQLFHFVGHAIADSTGTSLVLGGHSYMGSNDLATLHLPGLGLAVLSACDSASGDEGTPADINSLARTFLAIGATHVVASRWQVDSEVTRQLMKNFYAELMRGKGPAAALRIAENGVRSTSHHGHPFYWASFDVFGAS